MKKLFIGIILVIFVPNLSFAACLDSPCVARFYSVGNYVITGPYTGNSFSPTSGWDDTCSDFTYEAPQRTINLGDPYWVISVGKLYWDQSQHTWRDKSNGVLDYMQVFDQGHYDAWISGAHATTAYDARLSDSINSILINSYYPNGCSDLPPPIPGDLNLGGTCPDPALVAE